MAGYTIDKSRVPLEDETQIDRFSLLFVEHVEAKDLMVYLRSKFIFDPDDVQFIESAQTRKARIENLLSRLTMRGPRAYPEFKKALKYNGYKTVSTTIENEEESDPLVRGVIGKRVQAFEYRWSDLSYRVRKATHEASGGQSLAEFEQLDAEVSELRMDLLSKIRSLTKENLAKDAKIDELKSVLQAKMKALEEAEIKIASIKALVKGLKEEMKHDVASAMDNMQLTMKNDMVSAMNEMRDKMKEDMTFVVENAVSKINQPPAKTESKPEEVLTNTDKGKPTQSKGTIVPIKMNITATLREEHNRENRKVSNDRRKNKKR